ncbi:thermonuclease family protein [Luteolibacter algae]|uniref:Thermonuclease family protein n=1 Tax=Luteolibacter algae TaxID=454151 RepID=A0ABW5D617_9BACT
MSRPTKRHKSSSFIPILILIAAVSIWIHDAYKQGNLASFFEKTNAELTNGDKKSSGSSPAPTSSDSSAGHSSPSSPTRTGKYDTYHGCALVGDRSNDGDSFRVKLPDGKSEIIRLYFVDTPESAFKSYRGAATNHQRIQQQADDMGGISPQQAVEIGKKAKEFTSAILGASPFTLYTEWDSPFNDRRYHGFVEVVYGGRKRFLHELLVEKGYARIHTKGGQLPNGNSERKQENHLFSLERKAKSANSGAWGL